MLRSHKSSAAAALEKAVNDAARQAQADKEKDIATLTADLKNAKENLAQFKKEAEAHEKKLLAAKEEAHQAAMLEMQRHHQTALETLEQRFKDAITADKDRLDTALEALKADVKNTTTEALKQRQNEFQQTNSSSMKQIVEPLKETLQKMETALKENKSVHETSTATIKENIATLVSKAMQVSHSAERLSNALTAENKTQGCWGEQKIEALLDAMGLEKGLQYDSQEFLRDASGNVVISDETARRMQPDIILHLDATRDLIIDSKVSLRAFVEYTNAANDEDRSVALAAHIKSVRNHVKELAKKNYAAYVKHPRQSVDFVMMFVPIDSALQLALLNAPSLWREAMNQGVFIVGEQNLYAALRAVDVTWTTIKQDANNKAICEAGAELMDRVGLLLKRVTALGKCLESATNAYLDVKDKSINGQKGVLCAAKKLEKLGAKPSTKHPLPSPEIDDAATLSLPMDSEEHNK
jgi:DNA recombination protein RmuC